MFLEFFFIFGGILAISFEKSCPFKKKIKLKTHAQ
jgi:hypothetical protein